MTQHDHAKSLVDEAQELVDTVRSQVAGWEQALRDQGLTPDRLRAAFATHLTPQLQAEAEDLFRQDIEAVEQEAHEADARRRFAESSPGLPPGPHPMV
jgi:hypothetical protein